MDDCTTGMSMFLRCSQGSTRIHTIDIDFDKNRKTPADILRDDRREKLEKINKNHER